MPRLLLERIEDTGKQTIGRMFLLRDDDTILWSCFTVELPNLGNAPNISCIPKGKYKAVRRYSSKYKQHLHLLDVPNRSYILIHNANYHWQLKGCIAVGSDFQYIDKDNELDVSNSKKTLGELIGKIRELEISELEIEIVEGWVG